MNEFNIQEKENQNDILEIDFFSERKEKLVIRGKQKCK